MGYNSSENIVDKVLEIFESELPRFKANDVAAAWTNFLISGIEP